MLLFQPRSIGENTLLKIDLTLEYDSMHEYHLQGRVFIGLYVVGIPAALFHILYTTARPHLRNLDITKKGVTEEMLVAEGRNLKRFGLIYAKFRYMCDVCGSASHLHDGQMCGGAAAFATIGCELCLIPWAVHGSAAPN